jgi:hypothetical protein
MVLNYAIDAPGGAVPSWLAKGVHAMDDARYLAELEAAKTELIELREYGDERASKLLDLADELPIDSELRMRTKQGAAQRYRDVANQFVQCQVRDRPPQPRVLGLQIFRRFTGSLFSPPNSWRQR